MRVTYDTARKYSRRLILSACGVVKYPGFADKQLGKLIERGYIEPLKVSVHLVVAQRHREDVDFIRLKGFYGVFVYKLKLPLSGRAGEFCVLRNSHSFCAISVLILSA